MLYGQRAAGLCSDFLKFSKSVYIFFYIWNAVIPAFQERIFCPSASVCASVLSLLKSVCSGFFSPQSCWLCIIKQTCNDLFATRGTNSTSIWWISRQRAARRKNSNRGYEWTISVRWRSRQGLYFCLLFWPLFKFFHNTGYTDSDSVFSSSIFLAWVAERFSPQGLKLGPMLFWWSAS